MCLFRDKKACSSFIAGRSPTVNLSPLPHQPTTFQAKNFLTMRNLHMSFEAGYQPQCINCQRRPIDCIRRELTALHAAQLDLSYAASLLFIECSS